MTNLKEENTFPGGSKGKVNAAGNNIRQGIETADDFTILDNWRAAHRAVLNTFQAILRNRTKGKKISVAQRHKRKRTIIDKLFRFHSMQLSRMDDVAGCRLIFKNVEELYTFRQKFHKAKFSHKKRNELDKYDYIKNPKTTGYRGIHDVYEYNVRSETGKNLAGLLVELQYRTLVQHAWATAVEIIGFITESQPKFQKGDNRYEKVMIFASEILARCFENRKGPVPEFTDQDTVKQFLQLDEELGLLNMLKGLNAAKKDVSEKKNIILIFKGEKELQVKAYKDSTDALKELFRLEKELPQHDIVLVRADSSDEVRLAFRNYFSDAQDFINLIEQGCQKLSGKTAILPKKENA